MLSSPVQALIEIFNSELANVRFGDMDAKGLAHLASEVQSATDTVANAQASLDAARAMLLERQEAMLQHAERALAYARIYAETNEPLRARLDTVALGSLARSDGAFPPRTKVGVGEAGRRRKRSRKAEVESGAASEPSSSAAE